MTDENRKEGDTKLFMPGQIWIPAADDVNEALAAAVVLSRAGRFIINIDCCMRMKLGWPTMIGKREITI